MDECCFLTTLPTAVPYLHTNPETKSSKNQEQIFSKSIRLYKSHDKLSVTKPIKPPSFGHSLTPRVRIRSISPFASGPKKPVLDDLSLRYLEDPDNNIPGSLEDCIEVRNILQQLLDFYLSEYNYKDSIMIKKCIIKIDVEIFKYQNQDEIENKTEININIVVGKYINFWDTEYSEFLDFCKKENTRLDNYHKHELDSFDSSFKMERTHSPRFSNSARANRTDKPLNFSMSLKPTDRPLIVPDQSSKRKKPRRIENPKDRKDRIIDTQKFRVNAFVEFSNEIRALLIIIKKSFINDILRKNAEEK